MNKYKCYKCNNMAVWYYMPSSSLLEYERYYCDTCVSRGCSCNMIINFDDNSSDKEFYKDKFDRELPCVEYDYCETGFDEDE